jgi:hypothetical protein
MSIIQRRSPSATRGEVRNARLLDQKKGPDAVMVGVLIAALLLGLVGLAVHVLWIVAIVVMALGLGFAAANGRRDKIDVVNRSADREDRRADEQDEQPATQVTDDVRPDLPARQS